MFTNTCRVSKLSENIRIGQESVEDELADTDNIRQIGDRQNFTKDRLQPDMQPGRSLIHLIHISCHKPRKCSNQQFETQK